jgi:hypothetical protein|eukprot:COSAG06_NODE_3022_length_5949_cov_8.542051_5_plen_57_part_00
MPMPMQTEAEAQMQTYSAASTIPKPFACSWVTNSASLVIVLCVHVKSAEPFCLVSD